MFETLTDRLNAAFERLGNRGRLTEENVDEVMREVRRALLEADVNFKVVRDFVAAVRERSVGEEVLRSLTPAETVIAIVNEELIRILGDEPVPMRQADTGPTIIMLVGLQGSGKTTHAGKLVNHLRKQGRNPLLVAADIYRPAAITQLQTLGRQLDIPVYAEGTDQSPLRIAQNALRYARDRGQNPIIIDTAGRLQIDERMMEELEGLEREIRPTEILLVVDAMTGQEAVNVSQEFSRRLGVTGLILTKMDGDARGGAALSIRSVTGIPIKFIGTGERMDAIEPFYPDRLASRILGMGDVLSLIERAQEQTTEEDRQALEEKLMEGNFDLEDFLNQIQSIKKMGPLTQLLEMIPGIGSALREQNVQLDDDAYKQVEAIIRSMTPYERRNPEVIRGSRRRRIAAGSGTTTEDVTDLLKQFRDMQKMMAQLGGMAGAGPKKGKRSMMSRMPGQIGQMGSMRDMMRQAQEAGIDLNSLGGPGGMGGMPGADPRQLEKLMGGQAPLAPLNQRQPSKKASHPRTKADRAQGGKRRKKR
jgi:signal recognition particle subunit SRP54